MAEDFDYIDQNGDGGDDPGNGKKKKQAGGDASAFLSKIRGQTGGASAADKFLNSVKKKETIASPDVSDDSGIEIELEDAGENTSSPTSQLDSESQKKAVVDYMNQLAQAERTENNRRVLRPENAITQTKAPRKKVEAIPEADLKKAAIRNIEDLIGENIRKNEEELRDVSFKIYTGTVKPEELSELYKKDYGKKIIRSILSEVPDVAYTALDEEVYGSEKKWQEIAKAIQAKNRPQGVYLHEQDIEELNKEIASISGAKARYITETYSPGAGASGISGARDREETIDTIDVQDPASLGKMLEKIQGANNLTGPDGKPLNKAKIANQIALKIKYLHRDKPLSEDIINMNDKIDDAVLRVNMLAERGENVSAEQALKNDQMGQMHFKIGLNYIKDAAPAWYTNVTRGINKKGVVADDDFDKIAVIGQDIRNNRLFKEGAINPDVIGTETDIDYKTYSEKKNEYAIAIGEYLKGLGIKNVRQFSPKQISQAAKNLGLTNTEIVSDLIVEEQILGRDAIPKSGGVEAFVRGIMIPFKGLYSTAESIFNDDADVYLKSRQINAGDSDLPSDRGNVWYDALEGFGQFIPQVLLARGAGPPLQAGARFSMSQVPRATLTAAQAQNITNFGGTFISTYLQEYGNAYENALQQTGNANTARAMAALNGTAAAAFELFLPDTKIADRAVGIFKKNYATDLYDILKKGGSPEDLARQGQNMVTNFVKNTVGIGSQEVSEEVATNLANFITESIFSPNTAANRDLGNELWETAKATAVSMLIPSVLGGAGTARNNNFTVNGLHSAAVNFNDYKNALQKALIDDYISQDEYNAGIKMLTTHRESIRESPKTSSYGKKLSQSERLEYAYQETLIKAYKDQIEKTSSEVTKKDIEQKIYTAQDVQNEILDPQSEWDTKPKVKTTGKVIPADDWRGRVIPLEQEEALNEPVEPEIPLEQKIKSRIPEDSNEQGEGLQYFIDKTAEAPVAAAERFGQDVVDQILPMIPTEKLEQTYSDASKIDPLSAESLAIDAELSRRGKTDRNEELETLRTEIDENIKTLNESRKADLEEAKTPEEEKEINDYYDNRMAIEADRINQRTAEQPTVSETASALEVKKADIERRREDELSQPFVERNGVKHFQKKIGKNEWESTGETDVSINAKYDAELAEIQKQSDETIQTIPEGTEQKQPDETTVQTTDEVTQIAESAKETEITERAWADIPLSEKLKAAKENLPVTSNMSNREIIDLADQNAKMLHEKLKQQAPQKKEEDKADENNAEDEKTISQKGKELAKKMRSLKTKRDKLQSNIFGIPIAIYDGSLELAATVLEKSADLAEAISAAIKYIRDSGQAGRGFQQQEYIDHINDYMEGKKPRIKVSVGEEDQGQDDIDENENWEKNIADYEMTTSDEVDAMMSGETIEDVFGITPEGDQSYMVQKLAEMLQDGRNMIDFAMRKWGGDVMAYGAKLFSFIQGMSNDAALTNKKAVLLATFMGELQESMIREPGRRAEIQQLYNAVEAYYQRYMNMRAKELVAGRLLRLYRDKYLGDMFVDKILEEEEIRAKRAYTDALGNALLEDIESVFARDIMPDEKIAEDKQDQAATDTDNKKAEKRSKMSADKAKAAAAKMAEDIKSKHGNNQKLIDKIKDGINKLNCK